MPKVFIMGEGLDPVAKYGFDLTQMEITIGKGAENDIVIADDESISTKHCVIRRVLGGYIIKDLDSSNGIFQDGEKITKTALKASSVVKVANTELRFSLTKDQVKKLAKEPDKPQIYVTEELLPEIQSLHAGKIDKLWLDLDEEEKKSEAEESKPVETSAGRALATAPSANASQGGYRPPRSRAAASSQSAGNPMLGFIVVFILACLGILAGLYARHSQTHGSDFIQDLSSGKLESIFTAKE